MIETVVDEIVGKRFVTFNNGESKFIIITKCVVDTNAHPIYLVDHWGNVYPWVSILMLAPTVGD